MVPWSGALENLIVGEMRQEVYDKRMLVTRFTKSLPVIRILNLIDPLLI
jgi:hypothetical protein